MRSHGRAANANRVCNSAGCNFSGLPVPTRGRFFYGNAAAIVVLGLKTAKFFLSAGQVIFGARAAELHKLLIT